VAGYPAIFTIRYPAGSGKSNPVSGLILDTKKAGLSGRPDIWCIPFHKRDFTTHLSVVSNQNPVPCNTNVDSPVKKQNKKNNMLLEITGKV
jgi:hypothetical protein